MLKRKISKDEFAALPEAVQSEYKEHNGSYVLDVEDEDVSGLIRKNQELLDEKRKAQEQARAAAEEAARKAGDIQALEASWGTKLAEREKELLAALNNGQAVIRSLTIESTANRLASELAIQGSASALLPHIAKRLDLEMADGSAKIRVLDTSGKPSAMSIDELSKEIAADAALAPIIASSRASGGGASGGRPSGGAVKPLKDMTEAERIKFFRDDPAGFRKATEESKHT